jgi:hypothetical protein
MSDFKTVHLSVKNNCLIADPAKVFVTRGETLISFQLQIPGLAFAEDGPIRVVPQAGTFLKSWRVTSNTAALLDLYNQFGDFEYTVWVVRPASGPDIPAPFRLIFQTGLVIHNSRP